MISLKDIEIEELEKELRVSKDICKTLLVADKYHKNTIKSQEDEIVCLRRSNNHLLARGK